MGSATGDALEWALALLRAPGERHALRQRALPAGMERLLGIAAGAMPDASADAARALGESESTLRDAARFYAREVLFFPQADAYRVLGLQQDAGAGKIKAHHRLLQHWLHPDRLRSDDDSVFSARVNSAWNHLRTEERRHAYDQARHDQRAPEVIDSSGALRRAPAWTAAVDAPPPHRWRQRVLVLALFCACLLLAWLIVRDGERRPEDWTWAEHSADVDEDAGSLDIQVPERTPVRTADNRDRQGAIKPPRSVRDNGIPSGVQVPPARAMVSNAVLAPVTQVAVAANPGVASEVVSRSTDAATPTPAVVPPLPIPVPQADSPSRAIDTTASNDRRISAAPIVAVRAPREAAANRASSITAQRVDAATQAAFARTQLARRTGDQLLRYMAAVNQPPPPIWNSPAIQSGADRLRHDLHEQGRARLAAAQWRVGSDVAALTSTYRIEGGDEERKGQLSADMVWRENSWLVTGVSMERAR